MRRVSLKITIDELKKLANLPEDVEIVNVTTDYTWPNNPDICFHFMGDGLIPQDRLANKQISSDNMETITELFEVMWNEESEFLVEQQQGDFVPLDEPPRIGEGHDWAREGF